MKTLEDILVEHFGLKNPQDEKAWMEAYNHLIGCIGSAGIVTGCTAAANEIITVIDKIDTQNGEV